MSLRHTCLAILDWIPLHGYALREASRGYAWLHPMTNTNIYPTLRVLEQEGFVVHDDQVVDGRMRKVYRTTDAGRAELHRWLADPTEQPGVYRDPGLLKICLLREGTLRSARDWIRRDLAKIEEGMENARKFIDERESRIPPYSLLVARHGVDLARLRTELLRSVLEQIESDTAGVEAV